MGPKLLIIVLFIKIVVASVKLDVQLNNQTADLTYNGSEARDITGDEIHTLIGRDKLRQAFLQNLGGLGLIRDSENCGPSERVLSIKSATVKRLNMQPLIVMSQVFENSSNHTIKVNAGISYTVESTLTTSWSKEDKFSVTKDVTYDVSVGYWVAKGSYKNSNGFSFSTMGAVNETKSKSETIGTTSGVEVELKPGDSVTTVLSANSGDLEIEVVHQAYIKGDVPIPCDCDIPYGLNLHVDTACESIENMAESGGINNNLTTTETINFKFFVDGKLNVYENKSGLLIL